MQLTMHIGYLSATWLAIPREQRRQSTNNQPTVSVGVPSSQCNREHVVKRAPAIFGWTPAFWGLESHQFAGKLRFHAYTQYYNDKLRSKMVEETHWFFANNLDLPLGLGLLATSLDLLSGFQLNHWSALAPVPLPCLGLDPGRCGLVLTAGHEAPGCAMSAKGLQLTALVEGPEGCWPLRVSTLLPSSWYHYGSNQ